LQKKGCPSYLALPSDIVGVVVIATIAYQPLLPAVKLSGVYQKKLQQQTCSDGSQPDSNLKPSHPTSMTATREDNIGSFALIHLFDKVIP